MSVLTPRDERERHQFLLRKARLPVVDPVPAMAKVAAAFDVDEVPRVEGMPRDPAFEERCVREAADGLGLDHVAQELHTLASRRARNAPVQVEDRDLRLEAVEEVADLVNYCRWALQADRAALEDDHDRTAGLWEALKLSVLLYHALKRAG